MQHTPPRRRRILPLNPPRHSPEPKHNAQKPRKRRDLQPQTANDDVLANLRLVAFPIPRNA